MIPESPMDKAVTTQPRRPPCVNFTDWGATVARIQSAAS
jgi:hypothetical protein